MRACAKAFPDTPKTKLVFKTMGVNTHPREVAELESLANTLGLQERFLHISEYLSHADLYGLTAICDVYISLHRGEGFGIGMVEAMLMGRPVIATDWSANTEFCRTGASFPIPYRLVPVKPDEYFVSMKEWAEADAEAAAAALREIRSNPELVAERTAKGRQFMEEHFSIANFKKSVDAFLDGKP
jgi:glycosyltransferase involved in cell wall biosynthesis